MTAGPSASQDSRTYSRPVCGLTGTDYFGKEYFQCCCLLLLGDGLWSTQGADPPGYCARQALPRKAGKKVPVLQRAAGKGGAVASRLSLRDLARGFLMNLLQFTEQNHFLLSKGAEQQLPRILFPSCQIQTSLAAAMKSRL